MVRILGLLSLLSAFTLANPVRLSREAMVMGTRLAVTVEGASHEAAVAGSEAALRAVEHVDGVLSTWRTGTALGAVNAAPVGAAVSVPPELVSWMELAARWSRNTDRAFDPVIGSLVDAWDLRGEGRVPDPAALAQAVRQTGFRTLRLNARAGTITRLSAATWIDPGGFGKGVALGAALDSLRARGIRSAFLNFGGQVAALGLDHGRPWRVPIAHPDHRDRPVLSLALTDGSAATSGQSERYVLAGGRRYGHVLDPRTGVPVRAWGSVTVIDADPSRADILSTALFVMGPDRGVQWAARHGVDAVFIETAGTGLRFRCTGPAAQAIRVHDSSPPLLPLEFPCAAR